MAVTRITRGRALIGAGPLTVVAQASATLEPGALVPDSGTTLLTTVSGADFGHHVAVGAPYGLGGVQCSGYVHGAGTVAVRFDNHTAGTVTLASGSYALKVWA